MRAIQEIFDAFCLIAKDATWLEQDKIFHLTRLMDDALLTIDFRCGIYTPIMRLAEEGEHAAVEFLLAHFKASQDAAVEGYARGGEKNYFQVDALLKNGAKSGFAIRGYAAVRNEGRVAALITSERPYMIKPFLKEGRAAALSGSNKSLVEHAVENNVELIDAQLPTHLLAHLDRIICAFATAGNIGKVNQLMRDAHRATAIHNTAENNHHCYRPQMIADSYRTAGHLNTPEKLSRVKALTENKELRDLLSNESPASLSVYWRKEESHVLNTMRHIMAISDGENKCYSGAISHHWFAVLVFDILTQAKINKKSSGFGAWNICLILSFMVKAEENLIRHFCVKFKNFNQEQKQLTRRELLWPRERRELTGSMQTLLQDFSPQAQPPASVFVNRESLPKEKYMSNKSVLVSHPFNFQFTAGEPHYDMAKQVLKNYLKDYDRSRSARFERGIRFFSCGFSTSDVVTNDSIALSNLRRLLQELNTISRYNTARSSVTRREIQNAIAPITNNSDASEEIKRLAVALDGYFGGRVILAV